MDRHWNTRVGGGECGVFALFYLNEKTKNFPETKKTFAQHPTFCYKFDKDLPVPKSGASTNTSTSLIRTCSKEWGTLVGCQPPLNLALDCPTPDVFVSICTYE